MREPVNRTILLLDIERFSRRDDVVQAALRRTLNTVVDQLLGAAGVEATQQYREDRGDGLIVLISGDVAKTAVLRSLLTVTPELLHDHNRLASSSAQMRLRMVLAAGEVAHDPQAGTTGGLVGHDLNQAFRLLDSDALRKALAGRPDQGCVLAVSDPVYEGIVRHGHHGVRPELFRRTEVAVKDGVLSAWIHPGGMLSVPDSAEAGAGTGAHSQAQETAASEPRPTSGRSQQEQRGGAVFHFHDAPVIHGSLVVGDQHGVSSGQVTGHVILGGSFAEPPVAPRAHDARPENANRSGNRDRSEIANRSENGDRS
ncbi:hypothetical protein [Streptomyces sp. UNOB3_S3]|uniref:hypothetical protein n=1 Tax=Streptomyces sp. UNOB3_S3 TaxID=2871682 RepID=UPI001E648124|nr:hypothetical protein [Streptomyces sp. UNOB3_S3]